MADVCSLCKFNALASRVEQSRKVCDACAIKTGIVVMQPSKRPKRPCARCNHGSFIRAVPRELTVRADDAPVAGPMFAAYQLTGRVDPLNARLGFGVFETYICKACGYVEWYCTDPAEIPIGPEYMTEDFDIAGESPFR